MNVAALRPAAYAAAYRARHAAAHVDVDDLAQEAWIAMWRASRGYDPSRGPEGAYYARAARWAAWRASRRAGGSSEALDDLPGPSDPERDAMISRAMDLLSPRGRHIARMALDGYDGADIARAEGISRERARQLIDSICTVITGA